MTKKLLDKKPDILHQWDLETNAGVDPYDLDAWDKSKSYSWICLLGHRWQSSPYGISSGNSCKSCLDDLGDLSPESYDFMQEWSSLNKEPKNYKHTSIDKVKWDCSQCNNSWTSMIYARVKGAAKCPYCSGKKISLRDFSIIVSQLSPLYSELNLKPMTELQLVWKKDLVLWKCTKENHNYSMTIHQRMKTNNCPYCSNRRLLIGFNDLPSALPEVFAEWSPKNKLDPSTVLVSSRQNVLWICSKKECHKEWETSIEHRRDGSGCPSCSNSKPRKVRINDSLEDSSKLKSYWDYSSNKIAPRFIGKGSHMLIHLSCPLGHKWKQPARIAFRSNEDELCPYCRGSELLIGFNDLATTFSDLADEWHPTFNGTKKPSDFLPNSYERVWWICKNGHTINRTIAYRARYYEKCYSCLGGRSKLEVDILDFIVASFPDLLIISNDKSLLAPYELDIFIPERKIAIEVNGEYWHSDEAFNKANFSSAADYHLHKIESASKKGVNLVYLWENDWINNNNLAKTALIELVSGGLVSPMMKRVRSIMTGIE